MVKRVLPVVLILGLGACGGDPSSPDVASSSSGLRTVYWTSTDAAGHRAMKSASITNEQAQAMFAARKASKQRAAQGAGTSSALTVTSTDWADDCSSYDWILFTSQSDQGGDIFCANYVNDNQANTVATIPFTPAFVSPAASNTSAFFNLCPDGTSAWDCQVFQCPVGNVWQTYYYNSGDQNISPPAGTDEVLAQTLSIVC
jgi:hypothetical protein